MPKSENQKLKLLYLERILQEKTDEGHPMTVAQIIEELAKYGIKAERKSIYSDLEALKYFGLDLVCRHEKTHGYFVADKTFELPELKLLADAVACSKFITEKKSIELIKKISGMAGLHEAQQIKRHVVVLNRAKTANEQIYYNVDEINGAIDQGRKITFDYFDISPDKCKRYHDGRRTASPYFLAWDNEKYYLIAYHETRCRVAQFRVDRMENIMMTNEPVVPPPAGFDPVRYSKEVFSMFGGQEELVTLRFDNRLAGSVFDKFGLDIPVINRNEAYFDTALWVVVSDPFFGWLFQFNGGAQIISPEKVKERYLEMAERAMEDNTEN